MNRLFVDKLVSVGMVEAGDNPEAEVVIYKARTKKDNSGFVIVSGSAESPPITHKVNMEL